MNARRIQSRLHARHGPPLGAHERGVGRLSLVLLASSLGFLGCRGGLDQRSKEEEQERRSSAKQFRKERSEKEEADEELDEAAGASWRVQGIREENKDTKMDGSRREDRRNEKEDDNKMELLHDGRADEEKAEEEAEAEEEEELSKGTASSLSSSS